MKFDDRTFLQTTAPLVERLRVLTEQPKTPFYAPGHKHGQGISPNLEQWLGKTLFAADLPELPELDNLFAPESVIAEAQSLAAQAFGADRTWFLANGSTSGIVAAILATCQPGDKIILPRNSHQAAIAGLILTGAIPIFFNPA
ncbi:MAG: aminotransferase class I/II-fold pyridoxal phosphate-dependent enzyme, partial [Jaaginema sp. PMC 1079.18]|nr:aminotransferase class I/II-fold pyridoxal phosphate-dependent enzyme [Jaaginema sp. PMC 1079.18]